MSPRPLLRAVAIVAVLGLVACGTPDRPERIAVVNISPIQAGEMLAFGDVMRAQRPGIDIVDPGLVDIDDLDTAIDEVLAASPAIIVSVTSVVAIAVAERSPGIPHVFTSVNDPVGAGLVDDLRRPGDLTTGIGGNPHNAKAVEYLVEVTGASSIGILVDRGDAGSVDGADLAAIAAEVLGVDTVEIEVEIVDDDLVFEVPAALDGVVLPANSRLTPRMDRLARTVMAMGLPLAVASTGADPGLALITVEFDVDRRIRALAAIIDAVLEGEDPGLIPVVAPENRLTLNRTIAARFDLEFPPTMLVLADEIVD